MKGIGMNITHRIAPLGVHETVIELRWYAVAGSFLVEAVGLGGTPEEAEANARLLLGQARAELRRVTLEQSDRLTVGTLKTEEKVS